MRFSFLLATLAAGVVAGQDRTKFAGPTDTGWMTQLTDLFGWMTPGETKTFTIERRDEAIEWVQSG